jgi:hypothetical protein
MVNFAIKKDELSLKTGLFYNVLFIIPGDLPYLMLLCSPCGDLTGLSLSDPDLV